MAVIKALSALDLVGETPVVRLNRIVPATSAEVWLKLENYNIGGSVKDRIALNMIEEAEREGKITPGETTLIEATSGNTGIGLALIAAIKGYRLIAVMGEKASVERRQLMQAYGAELEIVPASPLGAEADLIRLGELVKEHGYYPILQFENPHNPEAHYRTTGPEILEAFGGKAPDAFVAGVGTGGTLTGTGQYLRKKNPAISIVAVEPDASPVLSGGARAPHAIQGIGAGFVPPVLDTGIYDKIIRVTNEDAASTARELARSEGLLLGISAGAATWAARKVARELGKGKVVLAIAPDTGERYLSTGLY
jgi:cysteine synthase A